MVWRSEIRLTDRRDKCLYYVELMVCLVGRDNNLIGLHLQGWLIRKVRYLLELREIYGNYIWPNWTGPDQIKLDPTCEIRDEVWPALTENRRGERSNIWLQTKESGKLEKKHNLGRDERRSNSFQEAQQRFDGGEKCFLCNLTLNSQLTLANKICWSDYGLKSPDIK